jgi:hypothetical protein
MAFNHEHYTPHYGWHAGVYGNAKDAARTIGIDIDDISFSGFWSQGDGASFTGSYAYAKGAAAAIRKEWPKATELHAIADRLQRVQSRNFYQLEASISRSIGHYCHEMTMRVDIDRADGKEVAGGAWVQGRYVPSEAEGEIIDAMRDFARWIYKSLETEYEYQQAWNLANGWHDAEDTASEEKASARALIKDIGAARRAGTMAAPTICAALHKAVKEHLRAMQEALSLRAAIADNFHYWADGKSIPIEQFAADNI